MSPCLGADFTCCTASDGVNFLPVASCSSYHSILTLSQGVTECQDAIQLTLQ